MFNLLLLKYLQKLITNRTYEKVYTPHSTNPDLIRAIASIICPITVAITICTFGLLKLNDMKHMKVLGLLLFATAALFAQPAQQWSNVYTIDTAAYEGTNDMAIDANGNIYQLIQTQIYLQNSTESKPVIRKISPGGNVIWSTIYTNGGDNNVTLLSLGIDAAGAVYTCGYRVTPNPNSVYFWHVAKFDNDGNFQWQHELSDPAFESKAHKLQVHNNAIYIAGYTYNAGTSAQTLLVKLNQAGTEDWKRYMECMNSWEDSPLLINASGNIVTGCNDSLVVLQADGSHYAAADSNLDVYSKTTVVADNNDNMYTFYWKSYDYVIRKFDANANMLWETDSIGYYLAFGDWQIPLVTDNDGNVYAGSIINSETGMDSLYIYKLNSNGGIVWAKLLNFDPMNLIYRNNKLYAAGTGIYDGKAGVWQIDPVSANIDWGVTIGDSILTQQADKLVIDNSGNFIFASRESGMGYWDAALTKFGEPGVGISEVDEINFTLYPNPTTDNILISSSLTEGEINMYDVRGSIVATHQVMNTITAINVSQLSAGVYYVRIGNSTKRFVKQ